MKEANKRSRRGDRTIVLKLLETADAFCSILQFSAINWIAELNNLDAESTSTRGFVFAPNAISRRTAMKAEATRMID